MALEIKGHVLLVAGELDQSRFEFQIQMSVLESIGKVDVFRTKTEDDRLSFLRLIFKSITIDGDIKTILLLVRYKVKSLPVFLEFPWNQVDGR